VNATWFETAIDPWSTNVFTSSRPAAQCRCGGSYRTAGKPASPGVDASSEAIAGVCATSTPGAASRRRQSVLLTATKPLV
jgi:hypothetical protein